MQKNCKECWGELVKKEKEWNRDFNKRSFCNNSCSSKYRMKNISVETRKKMSLSQKWKIPHNKWKKTWFVPSSAFKEWNIPWNTWKKLPPAWNKWLSWFMWWDKHWNWKWWITELSKKDRNSLEYKLWRDAIFARDWYACQICLEKWLKIHAHHILNFSSHPELRFAIDNWITICKKHHDMFHEFYWKRNNTKEQIDEFVWTITTCHIQN